MRRTEIVLAVFALFTIILIPALAQGGTIADEIANQGNQGGKYSILQQFLEASPEIQDKLDSAGSYTFFAPNDTAFENLEGAIGLPLTTLLSDVEVVTTILNYHILDTRLSAVRLRTNDSLLRTELQNTFISREVNSRDQISLNGVVEVVGAQNFASNGIVHEINDVLLNRVINNLLDEKFPPQPIATATPSPTEIPASVPRSISTANVRIVHLAIDAPAIDLTIGGTTIENIESGTVTEFTFISQGIYTATITSLDEEIEFTLDVDLTLLNGDFVTMLLIGSIEEDSLEAFALTEDFDDLNENDSRILLYHALEGASAMSLLPIDDFDIEGVRFAEVESNDIDSGDFEFSLVETRDNNAIFADVGMQSFTASTFYFIAIYGNEDLPELVILETTMEDVLRLQSGQNSSSTNENGENTVSDERDGTIFEVLQDDENFSLLVTALEAGDESILNLLNSDSNADGITLLAPSNQAFTNLLTTVGYSETRLLSNTTLLNAILEYHIIEESLLQEDFVVLSGSSIPTLLELSGRFFVRASNDGRIFLNSTVEFEQSDIQASNGVIQVVDDVLLPQVVLEAFGF